MDNLIRKLITIVIVFSCVAIIITHVLIERRINEPSFSHPQTTDKEEISGDNLEEKGIDLYGTYNQNDLLITGITEIYNGKEVQIPQIDGLKNAEIQDKINKDIHVKITNSLNQLKEITYSFYGVTGNFANVVSINFYVYDTSHQLNRLYFNYELVNGNELKFEDIFAKNADISSIVRKAFYSSLSRENYFNMQGDAWNEGLLAYPDENKFYKVVKGFINEKNKLFSLSPSGLSINYRDLYAEIDFVDIANDVVIYDKYSTNESLYKRDDIGYKNIFTCADANYSIFENVENGYLQENLWYDITINKSFGEDEISGEKLELFRRLKENLYQESLDLVDEYIDEATNNADKFYIVFSKVESSIYSEQKYNKNGGWDYVTSNFANTNISSFIYEMPFEVFNNKYKDELINAYRSKSLPITGGVHIPINEEDTSVNVIEINTSRIYNYVTGEQIDDLTDIFREDSNYMDIIKQKTITDLFKQHEEYTLDEINALCETIECKVTAGSIEVTIPSIPDYEGIIYFFQFEDDMFKEGMNIF